MKEKLISLKQQVSEKLTGREVSGLEESFVDPAFLSKISPVGGLDFSHERFVTTGTGYEACLYIYGYPDSVGLYWMTMLSKHEGSICCFDTSPTNMAEVKKNLKRTMEEHNSRLNTARNNAEMMDAAKQLSESSHMYELVNSGEILNMVLSRMYLSAPTMYELDVKVAAVRQDLEGSSFHCMVSLNETKSDWRNLFLSYSQQQKSVFKRRGQEMSAKAIAGGNPFHFSSLSDPYGFYYGVTPTGGAVLLDLFRKTKSRLYYNFLFMGMPGSGKSTSLKTIIEDRISRKDIVRVFDVTGEYRELVEYFGGKVINLDGKSKDVFNILQILPDESLAESFSYHLAKVAIIWRYLRKDKVEESEILLLKQLLLLLYVKHKICDGKGKLLCDLKVQKPEDFPILSDLLSLTKDIIDRMQGEEFAEKLEEAYEIRVSHIPILEAIELKLRDLCRTYGHIFDGHTTIENFYECKLVCFNMQGLSKAEEEIYDAQLYNALSVCWDNCVRNGKKMKDLFHKGTPSKDIVRSLVLIDEAHRSINANKLAAAEELDRMMREGRKFYGGFGLASQSVRDFVPDDASSQAVEKLRSLFELSTYKFIMKQDSNVLPKLRDIFQGSLTPKEFERIPTLMQRETILSIQGHGNTEITMHASDVVIHKGSGGE